MSLRSKSARPTTCPIWTTSCGFRRSDWPSQTAARGPHISACRKRDCSRHLGDGVGPRRQSGVGNLVLLGHQWRDTRRRRRDSHRHLEQWHDQLEHQLGRLVGLLPGAGLRAAFDRAASPRDEVSGGGVRHALPRRAAACWGGSVARLAMRFTGRRGCCCFRASMKASGSRSWRR